MIAASFLASCSSAACSQSSIHFFSFSCMMATPWQHRFLRLVHGILILLQFRPEMSHNSRPSVVLTLAMLLFSGCKSPEPKPEPKPVPEQVPEKPKKQSFVPPTAELQVQDDCTRRGRLTIKPIALRPDPLVYPIFAREQGTLVGHEQISALLEYFSLDVQDFKNAYNAFYKLSPPTGPAGPS
jgi:hypothetical protein